MKTRIKINKNLRGFAPGQTTMIEVDDNGVPIDPFWRKRLKDSNFDNCIEIVNDEQKEKPKKTTAKPIKSAEENTETNKPETEKSGVNDNVSDS